MRSIFRRRKKIPKNKPIVGPRELPDRGSGTSFAQNTDINHYRQGVFNPQEIDVIENQQSSPQTNIVSSEGETNEILVQLPSAVKPEEVKLDTGTEQDSIIIEDSTPEFDVNFAPGPSFILPCSEAVKSEFSKFEMILELETSKDWKLKTHKSFAKIYLKKVSYK